MRSRPAARFAALASRLQYAPLDSVEHLERDRAPLRLVAVEQRVGRALQQRGEPPAEAVGVLDAGVQPLAAGGRMHVGGVARQQDAPRAEAIGDPHVHAEGASASARLCGYEIVAPGPRRDQLCDRAILDRSSSPLRRQGRLQLEQIRPRERAQRETLADAVAHSMYARRCGRAL